MEVGAQIKELYDTLARIRDAKQQAAEIARRRTRARAMAAAAKTLTDKLVASKAT